MTVEELIENFEFLDAWEDKYKYIIELGEKLEPLAEEYHTADWLVKGCQSQVWLVPQKKNDGKFKFIGDSDAMIVKGLIAIVLMIYNELTAEEIKKLAINDIFVSIGLQEHLSPSRRNGLESMIERINHYASVL